MCGKTNCKIEAHHLLTESAFPQMSNQKENLIVLCVHCHKFGKESFHGTPKLMLERFEAKFPGRYEFLFKKAQTRSYVDYEGEYKQLKQTEK
jgi:5-methylcytosine-specific restriction endonuclease McrA